MKSRQRKRKRSPAGRLNNDLGLEGVSLAELLKRYPEVLPILDEHGIHFCAGCFLTLTLPLKKAASYHAVPDIGFLLRNLRSVIAGLQ